MRTAHSQDIAGIGVEGQVASANGKMNTDAQNKVAAATAAAGRPTNWQRIKLPPIPYNREAAVPASAAGQTLTPLVFPLARTATPTKPANNPMVRRALIASP